MLLARRIALVSCVLALVATNADAKPKDKHSLPPRTTASVDHIVVVMMENRSFDHLLGWHPTANALQAELSYPDENGIPQPTFALAPTELGFQVAAIPIRTTAGRADAPRAMTVR